MNKNSNQELKKNIFFKKKMLVTVIFFVLLFEGILFINFTSFKSYQRVGIVTVVPLDSLIFLLMGLVFLGISCFSVLQLYKYRTGKLFALYALLLGLSVSLAPCNRLNEPLITVICIICTFGSSLLLLWVIGYLTLLINKRLFRLLQSILVLFIAAGMISQILSFFSLEYLWIYIFSTESVNGSIVLSALFCLIVMGVNYKKSNGYAKKQSKILLSGIGIGVVFFATASFIPSVYLVQNGQSEMETHMELTMIPTETVSSSIPLLLFSGVSIAIIFSLMYRAFVINDMRLKLRYFVIVPAYFLILDVLIITYGDCPLWLLFVLNVLFLIPLFIGLQKILNPVGSAEEQTYQWRLIEEVEREKQELSVYLHDEVLQLLIAFYRQIQADSSGQYSEMKTSLSGLISQVRSISHNLYPTMVEDLGLEQSLLIFTDELRKNYPSIKVTYEYYLADGILPKSLALAFYRISKELVINAAKHSGGLEVNLSLSEDCDGYYIRVRDNGSGFPVPGNDDLLQSPHMGLYTLKKQVMNLQGQIDFNSDSHTGTDYNIYFPKKEAKN